MKSFLESHRQSIGIAVVLILTFLIYSPTLHHEFVNWDDNTHITQNPMVRSLSVENIEQIFTSTVHRTYIPLTILSFAIEYHFFKLEPLIYHLNNLLLHLLVVYLVFHLGLRLGLKNAGAAAAALLFAIHPIHVESVAWATERKDVLYSAFYLGAVLAYLHYLRTQKRLYYICSLLMGFLSMLSKPMALSLPLILILCDWFVNRSFKKEHFFNKIPYLLFIVPLAAITFNANLDSLGQQNNPSQLFPLWAGTFYIKKFFWPVVLCPLYVPVIPQNFFHFEYWSVVGMVVAGMIAFVVWKNRWFRFALLWYVGSIFFLLNYDYTNVTQSVADRFMYLPSLGFCFLAGYGVEKIWNLKDQIKFIALGIIIIFFLLLSIKTSFQITVWRDSFSLWDYTVRHSPTSFMAYNNRGRIYESRQQWDRAIADYQESIRLNPKFAKAYKNLGMSYEGQGDLPSAMVYYTQAIAVNPQYSAAYNNRGLIYQKTNDFSLALADFDKAIAADAAYALGYANRGELLARLGQSEMALRDLLQARRMGFPVDEKRLNILRTKVNHAQSSR